MGVNFCHFQIKNTNKEFGNTLKTYVVADELKSNQQSCFHCLDLLTQFWPTISFVFNQFCELSSWWGEAHSVLPFFSPPSEDSKKPSI